MFLSQKFEKFSIADDLPRVIPVVKEAVAINPSRYLFATTVVLR